MRKHFNWIQRTANWKERTANWKERTANWIQRTANWKQRTANWKERTANWIQRTANWKQRTANWKVGLFRYFSKTLSSDLKRWGELLSKVFKNQGAYSLEPILIHWIRIFTRNNNLRIICHSACVLFTPEHLWPLPPPPHPAMQPYYDILIKDNENNHVGLHWMISAWKLGFYTISFFRSEIKRNNPSPDPPIVLINLRPSPYTPIFLPIFPILIPILQSFSLSSNYSSYP